MSNPDSSTIDLTSLDSEVEVEVVPIDVLHNHLQQLMKEASEIENYQERCNAYKGVNDFVKSSIIPALPQVKDHDCILTFAILHSTVLKNMNVRPLENGRAKSFDVNQRKEVMSNIFAFLHEIPGGCLYKTFQEGYLAHLKEAMPDIGNIDAGLIAKYLESKEQYIEQFSRPQTVIDVSISRGESSRRCAIL